MQEPQDIFPLWRFSLDRYARKGVAEICLWLQERAGADVNIVLAALWAGDTGRRIDGQIFQTWNASAIGAWHRKAVRPLRTARIHAKVLLDGPHGDEIAALRMTIKKAELEAERIEQHMLWRALEEMAVDASPSFDSRETARANLAGYFAALGTGNDPELIARATQLAEACVD